MNLIVKVIKAILTHNTEIGSNMDPFVVLKIGTNQQRGQTFEEIGDMPEFNQTFVFPISPKNHTLHLIVYDQDTTVDDLVGEVQIDLKPILLQSFTEKKWYSLKYNGKKPAGKILLEFQCERDGKVQAPSKNQIKQILRPHIHPIGMAPQNVPKRQLYGVQFNFPSRITESQTSQLRSYMQGNQVQSQNQIRKPIVFSFRNNQPIHLAWGSNHSVSTLSQGAMTVDDNTIRSVTSIDESHNLYTHSHRGYMNGNSNKGYHWHHQPNGVGRDLIRLNNQVSYQPVYQSTNGNMRYR